MFDSIRSACPLRDNAVSEKLAQAQPLASGAQADTGSTVMARVVPAEEPWLSEAGARLRAGKLVAFPTGDSCQQWECGDMLFVGNVCFCYVAVCSTSGVELYRETNLAPLSYVTRNS